MGLLRSIEVRSGGAAYRLMMRPVGVVSKNAMGARSSADRICSWKTRAARTPASEKTSSVMRMLTAEAQQKMLYVSRPAAGGKRRDRHVSSVACEGRSQVGRWVMFSMWMVRVGGPARSLTLGGGQVVVGPVRQPGVRPDLQALAAQQAARRADEQQDAARTAAPQTPDRQAASVLNPSAVLSSPPPAAPTQRRRPCRP